MNANRATNLKFVASAIPSISRRSQNFKVGHMTPISTFWPNFVFICIILIVHQHDFKSEVSTYSRSTEIQDIRKFNRSRDQGHAPLSPILHFSIVLFVVNLYTKFEVCSLSRSRDIEGVPKLICRSRGLNSSDCVSVQCHEFHWTDNK